MTGFDPVKVALDVALKVKRLVDIAQPERAVALSRRARELPTLILQTGLMPALTFYLSKVEKESVYMLVLKALEIEAEKMKPDDDDLVKKVKKLAKEIKEEVEEEGKGYTALLSISAYILKQFANMYGIEKCKNVYTVAEFVECLHEIRSNRDKEVMLEKQFINFMLEVKKLFDAFFKEKEQG